MVDDNRTRVIYEILADFSSLSREARQARRELGQLQAAENAYNTSSQRNRRASATAAQARQRATTAEVTALRTLTGLLQRRTTAETRLNAAVRLGTAAIQAENRALDTNISRLLLAAQAAQQYARAQSSISRNAQTATTNIRQNSPNQQRATPAPVRFTPDLPSMAASDAARQYAANADQAAQSTTRWGRSIQWLRGQVQSLSPVLSRAEAGANRLHNSFQRFGNWRPRFVPPFVALVPVIASVVAAFNPLISLLGAVGSASFGLVSNIASLSGAFLALPGILSAVVGGITSVIASMGGVGNVFKTYSAMQKAVGTGASAAGAAGESAAERADRLARAELNLARAQRNVQKAQQNLNKARQQALEDLQDLRQEVERSSLNEDRAIANLQQARDAYNNVLADPDSQLGDKLAAAVEIREAEAELADVRRRNAEAQAELTEAERRGVEGSEQVLDAKEALQDAVLDERDAQRDLRKEYDGTTQSAGAMATATDAYNEALARLSPSARAVVLALIAMKDNWEAMQRSVQEEFFAPIVGELGRLPSIIETIGTVLRPSARAMGEFVAAFMRLIDSPAWKSDLATIGENNADVIENLGGAFLHLITFFKDLMIAAAPFTDWLTGEFEDGMENLSQLLDTDAEKNGLAAWLEKVRGRLERWGRIVGNVAETLFNYGSAAGDFGDWIAENLEEMTEGWKTNSQDAAQDGSAFKQYLEDIKPLLEIVGGLVGDFFSWFSRESMEIDNIQDMEDLATGIGELGSAIGELFDALAATDIDDAIIDAMTAIVGSITGLIEAGAGQGFEAFMDTVVWFFEKLEELLSGMEDGEVSLLMQILGTLAALALVGKFTGLTNAIGWLLALDKAKFVGALAVLGKMGLVAAPVAGVTASAQNIAGQGNALGKANEALANGDSQGAENAATENGALAKGLLGPLIQWGNISEVLGWFSPEAKQGLDNNLERVSEDILTWAKGLKKNVDNAGIKSHEFFKDTGFNAFNFSTGVVSFFSETGTNFANFGLSIVNGWNKLWNEDVPAGWAAFKGLFGPDWQTFWTTTELVFDTFGALLRGDWETVSTNLTTLWEGFKGLFGPDWQIFWDTTELVFSTVGALLRGDWETVSANISQIWEGFKNSFGPGWAAFWNSLEFGFKTVMALLSGDTETAVSNIGQIWAGIQNLFKDPINWVIRFVINDGLLRTWNSIAKSFGWTQIPNIGEIGAGAQIPKRGAGNWTGGGYREGGVLPGYNPGVDNHHFVDQNGVRLDLGGGEGILVPQATRMLGGKQGIDQINRNAKAGRQAFRDGGVFGSLSEQSRKPGTGGVWEVAGDVWDKFQGFFKGPINWIKDIFAKGAPGIPGVDGLLGNLASRFGNTDYIQLLSSVPRKAISNIAEWAAGKAKEAKRKTEPGELSGGGAAPANVMGWQAQWAAVKKAFPGANLNSAYRPGAITSTGSKSYHGQGRAIDVTASMAIFNWLKENYPNSRELIYSPANGRQIQNGREFNWPNPVRAQHFDHVHWAMRHGGVFPGAGGKIKGTHDSGGWLRNGQAAVNLSGRPEAVLNPDQSRALHDLTSLLSANSLSTARSASLGLGGSVGSLQGAAQQIIDQSINIDKVEVVNPVPETLSESLPKSIRRIGYMRNARENA